MFFFKIFFPESFLFYKYGAYKGGIVSVCGKRPDSCHKRGIILSGSDVDKIW